MEETGELNFFVSSIFTDIAYFRTVPIATLSAEKGREKRSPIASNAALSRQPAVVVRCGSNSLTSQSAI